MVAVARPQIDLGVRAEVSRHNTAVVSVFKLRRWEGREGGREAERQLDTCGMSLPVNNGVCYKGHMNNAKHFIHFLPLTQANRKCHHGCHGIQEVS